MALTLQRGIDNVSPMADFWFLLLSIPAMVLPWRSLEALLAWLTGNRKDAPRYVTLI